MSNEKEQAPQQPQEKPQPRAPHLLARSFKHDAMSIRMVSFAIVPAGTSVDALKDPAFWANVASLLASRQRIDVEPEDGSWLAELRVASVGPNWARVQVLHHHKFTTAQSLVQKSKDFKIEWGGQAQKQRVVRISDRAVVKSGFDTPEQAAEWLAANVESMTG